MTTVEVRLKLSDDMLSYFQRKSKHRKLTLDDLLSEEIERIVAELLPPDDDESDETP